MFKKKSLFLIIILLVFNGANAGEYDLQAILRLAEKNNKEIRLAKSDLKMAAAQRKEAISTALPKLNVDFNYNRNFFDSFFYVTITDSAGNKQTSRFATSFNNEYQMNAVLSQTLYGFGKIGNAIQAAKYYSTLTNYQYQNTWQEVMIQVKKAFYQALLQQKVWEVAQQSQESAQENYENLKTKYESGVVSEFDLLQAEVRWQNSIPETMRARQNFILALNNLKAMVEIPLNEEVVLIGELETHPVLPDTIQAQQIFQNRPDYNALIWEKRLQEKRVAIEHSNYLPTLNGNLTYMYGARSDQFKLENDNDNLVLGLSLNVPLFTGGYTSAQVQKARVDVEKANTRIEQAQENIQIDLVNVYLRLNEARQRIQAAQKGMESARRAFDIAETQVENGLATQVELKDSRVFLDQAQLNYYSATYDYLDAYFDWQLLTGNVNASGI